ncbi:MAG TPA: matrixin family metalloprotease [Pyrinomonadaceae bacterium]|jgi:predicted Zn-dependent protease|nr:matrixin family metalloprotease [Pyrinomonadaceae bacterium]
MRRSITALILVAIITMAGSRPALSYTLQFTDGSSSVRIRWPNNVVTISLSTSLGAPPANIKAGSDVMGAARRALLEWAGASNIRFVEASSSAQSISPSNGGDSVSLITVANTAENAALFTGSDRPGRTRVFFDPATGLISEADIALNPSAQFSTDGTFGTYDLEAVLTHELGHLLGLEHSGMVGATMQPRLALNGLYTLPAFSARTLSEDDRAGARSLYGPQVGQGAIAGSVSYAGGAPAYGAHVWAQDIKTGRSIAGSITSASGAYRIEDLPPGQYRLIAEHLNGNVVASEIASSGGAYAGLTNPQAAFRATEVTNPVTITAATTTPLNISLSGGEPFLNPRLLGINGQLSTIAVPVEPGRTYTVYVGGDGLDQVAAQGITVTSPYMTVEASSLVLQQLGTTYPIISFNVRVEGDVPAGDYDLRFRSNNGEVAYIAGGLTVDDEGGALLLAMTQAIETAGEDEGGAAINSAPLAFDGTDETLSSEATTDGAYLSDESVAAGNLYVARRVERAGRGRAVSFEPLKSAAEERFKALVQPFLKRTP